MIYINRRTRAVISTECVISGGDWEPMGNPAAARQDKSPSAAARCEAVPLPDGETVTDQKEAPDSAAKTAKPKRGRLKRG